MDGLKRKCLRYFVVIIILLTVSESILDSIFEDVLFRLIPKDTIMYGIVVCAYVLFPLLFILIAAFCFWKSMNRLVQAEMKKQMEEKNLMIANITHDLKTPITSILGFSKMLSDHSVETANSEEIAEIIYKKSKKTNDLINEMFSYVKLDTTSYELRLEKTDLGSLVRNLVADLYDEYEKRQMEVEIEIPRQPCYAFVDSVEMERAVSNLLVNAYRHNADHSKIKVEVASMNDKIVIRVMDNGEVIPEEIRETIFEPFVRGDTSGSSKNGSGLGLAIAKKIIEKHEGILTIKNAPKREIDTKADEYTKMFEIRLRKDSVSIHSIDKTWKQV